MQRVSAHVAAAFVLVSVAFVFSTIGVLAKENPGHHYGKENNPGNHYGQLSNPGHHYGQLKHATPPPVPSPPPLPTPNPVTHPGAPGDVFVQLTTTIPGLTDGGASTLPDVPVTLPPQDQTAGRQAASDAAAGNALEWLILFVLPALLAIWAIVFARIAMAATRRRRTARAAALVSAPSTT